MSLDPTHLESDLSRLNAAALDERLLERLDACIEGTWTELDPVELAFENSLRGYTPVKLPAALMASLEATVSDVRFPNNEKILRFPKKESAAPARNRGWWGAAAAVAITGALTALMVPVKHETHPGTVVSSDPKPPLSPPVSANGALVPASFNRNLREASDQGVIWQSDNRPQQLLKVVYQDRVTLKDAQGRTYQVEQPRVEYILVPAKTD